MNLKPWYHNIIINIVDVWSCARVYRVRSADYTETVGRRPAVRGQMSPSHAQPSFYYKCYYYYSRTVLRFVWVGRPGGTTAAVAAAHNHWILCAHFSSPPTHRRVITIMTMMLIMMMMMTIIIIILCR